MAAEDRSGGMEKKSKKLVHLSYKYACMHCERRNEKIEYRTIIFCMYNNYKHETTLTLSLKHAVV